MDIKDIAFNIFSNFSLTMTPVILVLIISSQFKFSSMNTRKVLLGIGLGIAAVVSGFVPLEVIEGASLDFRHVLTALSGLLGGPISAVITAIFAMAVRIPAGGIGMWGSIISIITCGICGILWRILINKYKKININIVFIFVGMTAASLEMSAGFSLLIFIPAEQLFPLMQHNIIPIYISNIIALVSFGSIISIIESRRNYREQLEKSEKRYSQLIDFAPDGIAGIQNGKIFFINDAAAAILKYTKEELIGCRALSMIAPEHRNETINLVRIHINHKNSTSLFESTVIAKDNTFHDVEFAIGLIQHNNSPAIMVFSRDISKRKHSEKERIRLEEHLRQVQKMEAVGRLAGGIAHDFNNLLQVILGYLDILNDRDEPHIRELKELHEIGNAAERAAELTQQLLAFSRKQIMQKKDLNINDVILGLLKLITRSIGEHIKLSFKPNENLGTVCVDKSQFEQVILNLCVNSRDAMPSGGKLIIETSNTILETPKKSEKHTTQEHYVEMTVSDTGHGMDDTTRKNLFEPFFTTKDPEHGTGLGLSTVYGIIKQHDGKINVYSEINRGTSFKIYLPRVDRKAEELIDDLESVIEGGKEAILVAEDDPAVLKLVSTILNDAGYSVTEAVDGEQALELFKINLNKFELVILDIVMPKMSGIEVIEHIQRFKPELPFIFSSGYSPTILDYDFFENSNCVFIHKPYQKTKLLRTVRETLDAKKSEF